MIDTIELPEDLFDDIDISYKEIESSEWMPDHKPREFPVELWEWINSINRDWRKRKRYKKYEKYRDQAYQWLKIDDDIQDYSTEEEQTLFLERELYRCKENTLYFANKYGYLKDTKRGGRQKYIAFEPQEVLLFLVDSGYNLMVGKGRQIGFTTTMAFVAAKRINHIKSYFVKFISCDEEKTQEIFNDKIKYQYVQVPFWLKAAAEGGHDSSKKLHLREKSEKGDIKGMDSKCEVDAPAVDAINGGAPDLVLVDEFGLIRKIGGQMLAEGRPTLFRYDTASGEYKMERQLVAWSTGGEMEKGGAVMEAEFTALIDMWSKKKFSSGMIPVFFNAYAREGVDEKQYHSEKEVYYSVEGPEKEIRRVQFHQHYPLNIEDMFLRKSKTLVPHTEINKHLSRIYLLQGDDIPQYGRFEPIFDTNQPYHEEFGIPFKIIGSKWVPTRDIDDPMTTACIYRHPEKWKYRYFAGTDPINTETGNSFWSTTIWDVVNDEMSAMIFYRERDFTLCYLQSILMTMYYEPESLGGCMELVENNIGDHYYHYREQLGLHHNMVSNKILPKHAQSARSKWWGISNKSKQASFIISSLVTLLKNYSQNINSYWFWHQVKTFVEKELPGQEKDRQTRFQADNRTYNRDDSIFSGTIAYINAEAHSRYEPQPLEQDHRESTKYRYKTYQGPDTDWKMVRVLVDENGKPVHKSRRRA